MNKRVLGVLVMWLLMAGQTVLAERLTVSSVVANIRSGAGTKFEVLWQVEKYHPLKVIEKKGNWYRFEDFEGDQGWIHRSMVGTTEAVITSKVKCNVRTGPNTKKAIRFTVGKGVPFRKLGRKGNWIHIEHADGDTGWIHRSLVW